MGCVAIKSCLESMAHREIPVTRARRLFPWRPRVSEELEQRAWVELAKGTGIV
jgi:hypothetical protein